MRRVRVGITVGDPAGIGPEIAEKARTDPRVTDACEPVIFAPAASADVRPGEESAAGGRAAYDTLLAAMDAARRGQVDAIATAPVSKRAFALAGLPWKGHTDLLAHLCGVPHVRMLFYAEAAHPLCVTLATVQRCSPGNDPRRIRGRRQDLAHRGSIRAGDPHGFPRHELRVAIVRHHPGHRVLDDRCDDRGHRARCR